MQMECIDFIFLAGAQGPCLNAIIQRGVHAALIYHSGAANTLNRPPLQLLQLAWSIRVLSSADKENRP